MFSSSICITTNKLSLVVGIFILRSNWPPLQKNVSGGVSLLMFLPSRGTFLQIAVSTESVTVQVPFLKVLFHQMIFKNGPEYIVGGCGRDWLRCRCALCTHVLDQEDTTPIALLWKRRLRLLCWGFNQHPVKIMNGSRPFIHDSFTTTVTELKQGVCGMCSNLLLTKWKWGKASVEML